MAYGASQLPDYSKVTDFLEAQPKRIFTLTELQSILKDHDLWKHWQPATRIPKVIKGLLKNTKLQLHQLDFPAKKQKRFTWGEVPIHQILLSLNPRKAYFSHLTALHLHRLSNKNLKTIYVNWEQSPKPRNQERLEQAAIDEAFSRPPRITRNWIQFHRHTVYLLNGMNTGELGIESITSSEIGIVRVTNIERTLIDIVVRPSYSGGVLGILNAFRKSRGIASVATILQMLKELDYAYPYHQAIGFYLDASGLTGTAALKELGLPHKFYLDHQISNPGFSDEWQVFFPKEVITP
jgi:hypothetical protein